MGNKFWSILFGVTMLACLIGFAISPLMGWWMPDGISTHAGDVDFLFYVILWITTFFFILTEAILVFFMWQYSSQDGKPPVSDKADVINVLKPLTNLLDSQHKVEMAWTLVPAAILLYIAFAQVNTWANIKYESRRHTQQDVKKDGPALQIGVSAGSPGSGLIKTRPAGRIAPAAVLRGGAVGALTAALAVAAHGIAGGGLPSGSVAILLALLAITLGALVSTMRDTADVKVLVGVLAIGQLSCHALLAASGHAHGAAAAPAGPMVAAHVVAIAVGASLIAVGGRLCAAVSRVRRASSRPTRLPVGAASPVAVHSADQPRQSARLLSASLSHRGPPVGLTH